MEPARVLLPVVAREPVEAFTYVVPPTEEAVRLTEEAVSVTEALPEVVRVKVPALTLLAVMAPEPEER